MGKVLVLGVGLQGRAVVHDLVTWPGIDGVVAADLSREKVRGALTKPAGDRAVAAAVDAADDGQLAALLTDQRPDAVICMLPPPLGPRVARAALDAGAHYVSTSYTGELADLDRLARERGLAVLPEMGMDPGIDLVLGHRAVAQLDEVHGLDVFGGGLPDAAHADANPLRYKITWTFEGVLTAYVRPARLLDGGVETSVPGTEIFHPDRTRREEVPGVGPLEVYPNGDALGFIDTFGLGPELKDMGRYSLRWPGHCALWYPLVQLGLLDDTPLDLGRGLKRTPRQLLAQQLGARLGFADHERDVCIVRVRARGLRDGRPHEVTYDVVDRRDLDTGLFAMNRLVGFTAAIGARMLLSGAIEGSGVLSPARDVPPDRFVDELQRRGIRVSRDSKEVM